MSIFLDAMTGADYVPGSQGASLGMWALLSPLSDGEAVKTRAERARLKNLWKMDYRR